MNRNALSWAMFRETFLWGVYRNALEEVPTLNVQTYKGRVPLV